MAQFDNVTYEHYSGALGRAIVPDAATFNQYKLENVLYMKSLLNDGLIKEREPGGIDDACCMMIEESYNAAQIESGSAGAGRRGRRADIGKHRWLQLYGQL